MAASSPIPGNPTGTTRFTVHRLETVRVRVEDVVANSPEEAVSLTNSIDLHKLIDKKFYRQNSSQVSGSISFEDGAPVSFMVDPLDVDGEVFYNQAILLSEDRNGNLYRLPPSLVTECDEALKLVDKISDMDISNGLLSSTDIEKVLLALINEARFVRERHNAFPAN